MGFEGSVDKVYAQIMSNHPFGIALYRPQKETVFRIGSCGYFDSFGSWNPIANLEDAAEVKRKGLTPIEVELERAPIEDDIRWGPKVSSTAKATALDLTVGLPVAPGIPVNVSTVFKYTSDLDTGAILLTESPITHERFYHESPFKNWIKKNSLNILKIWPEVRTYGLWVVTSTFATQRCAINLWSKKGQGLHVGFSADVAGLGEVGPEGEWYRSQTDEGWVEYGGKGKDRTVVFFGGLKFQYTWLMNKQLKPLKAPKFRGAKDNGPVVKKETVGVVDDPEDEDAGYIVDCEEYLENDPSRTEAEGNDDDDINEDEDDPDEDW
ncbi:hypothetical protein CVT24_002646 [Panaeolus cyanescens]|uniref:Uncharacterized protein n=1 Tax=Panaeolus cyanescens TaxID=181874 RepID=A0A409YY78_9AGAR|nr:hypothetical protein CVT24_002646 [Panaeolus cyanescens]